MISIRHAGDLGDVLYSLPAIKWLCEKYDCQAVFHMEQTRYTREPMTPAKVAVIAPLLLAQPYIADVVEYRHGDRIDVNMNDFRAKMFPQLRRGRGHTTRLSDWQRAVVGAPQDCQDVPWLTVTPRRVAKYVINRTLRYHNPRFPWQKILMDVWHDCVFIGLPEEKQAFHDEYLEACHFPLYVTYTLLEAAEVIAGADCFIGNQSCCFAIAEGLKKPALLEVYPQMPNCLFNRPDLIHGWDESSKPPVSPSATGLALVQDPGESGT